MSERLRPGIALLALLLLMVCVAPASARAQRTPPDSDELPLGELIEVVVERRKATEAVEVIVTDNGRGMTPAEQRRAFEPGYTTKRRGWGLGLALARRVAQEYHGGEIRIRRSARGEGTTIVLTFPT